MSRPRTHRRELVLLLGLLLLNLGVTISVWVESPQRLVHMPIVVVPLWPRWTVNVNVKPTVNTQLFAAPYEVASSSATITAHAWIYDTGAKRSVYHVSGIVHYRLVKTISLVTMLMLLLVSLLRCWSYVWPAKSNNVPHVFH